MMPPPDFPPLLLLLLLLLPPPPLLSPLSPLPTTRPSSPFSLRERLSRFLVWPILLLFLSSLSLSLSLSTFSHNTHHPPPKKDEPLVVEKRRERREGETTFCHLLPFLHFLLLLVVCTSVSEEQCSPPPPPSSSRCVCVFVRKCDEKSQCCHCWRLIGGRRRRKIKTFDGSLLCRRRIKREKVRDVMSAICISFAN